MKSFRYIILSFLLLIFLSLNISSKKNNVDFHNFYGISWKGGSHENLLYAKQMGYDYVFYQYGMEKDSISNGLFFYLESPEYLAYNRVISKSRKYTGQDSLFYSSYCALSNDSLRFPNNLATGWFFNDSTFSAELDFQKKHVRDWTINKILDKVKEIESRNPNFHFGGFAWDVPQLTGDFWSRNLNKGGRQISLGYWHKASRNATDMINEGNYVEGRAEYYKLLFSRTRQLYPNAKFIMEPHKIYEDWMQLVENRIDAKKLMPNLLCQESFGLEFVDDKRIYKKHLINKNGVASTTPNCYGEKDNRTIAAKTAINGAWFGWFGRFGGTGDMPNYTSIKEVPPRLKLIRMLPNWENLNRTPLAKRRWDGENYNSSTATVNPNIIAIKKPKSQAFFVVFLNEKGSFSIPKKKKVYKSYITDSLFQENHQLETDLIINNNVIKPIARNLNKGYIIYLK